MKKLIQNRTIGLQRKEINDLLVHRDCNGCDGKGSYSIQMSTSSFRNIKNFSGVMDVDCNKCDATGKIENKIRIIRKNKITAII